VTVPRPVLLTSSLGVFKCHCHWQWQLALALAAASTFQALLLVLPRAAVVFSTFKKFQLDVLVAAAT
jgi:hypothetical protein